jgi:hypothetical protein
MISKKQVRPMVSTGRKDKANKRNQGGRHVGRPDFVF